MLPGFLRVQSGPGIRVVGCTGMHTEGGKGRVGRGHSCGVAASLTHRALREKGRNERGRERGGRQQPEREREKEKGRDKEPKEEGIKATSRALARPRAQLERVFLPFHGGNRVCSAREHCFSRDPFPATLASRSRYPDVAPASGNR